MTDTPLTKFQLFRLFAGMSLMGFGGVMPWAHRILVERRRIVDPTQFLEILAYAQLLPGPTICHIGMIVGHRQCGQGGAWAALAGMIVPPFVFVVGLATLHQIYGQAGWIQDLLRGMAVASAALVAAMALRMSLALPRTIRNLIFAAAMFAGIALLHWPLLLVMLGLGAMSLAIPVRER
ncbi:chromate transporter [Magnetospirillum sp. 64-120]|uniref:chromate transporter n=1 Tax=Magnetospirillum sp. 64-120 TaxID=1895778 RepID=UPI000927715F|nr:chromate transporter [Magnetospirillum sp. 64-120]OJX68333.1 MAG: chromate transport protein (chra-like) [Magnetospirillum sp. 64-120]